jgi:hypothetical protein
MDIGDNRKCPTIQCIKNQKKNDWCNKRWKIYKTLFFIEI